MSIEYWWNDTNRGKPETLEENLSQYPLCLSQIPPRLAWYSTRASADMLAA